MASYPESITKPYLEYVQKYLNEVEIGNKNKAMHNVHINSEGFEFQNLSPRHQII